MPDLIQVADDLKHMPDGWLAQQAQQPSGMVPPYLVMAEMQRREKLRSGQSKAQAPQSSVAQDMIRNLYAKIPPTAGLMPQQQPPGAVPPGMPPVNLTPSAGALGPTAPGNLRLPPTRTMADGGEVGDEDQPDLYNLPLTQEPSRASLMQQLYAPPVQPAPAPPVMSPRGTASRSAGRGLFNAPGKYDAYVRAAAEETKLDPDFIRSVMNVESNQNPNAVSGAGAVGLMQVLPSTAMSEFGVTAEQLRNPATNIMTGARYLRKLVDLYHGDQRTAAMAYNMGPGNIAKGRTNQGYANKVLDNFQKLHGQGGAPPVQETGGMPGWLASSRNWNIPQVPDTGDAASAVGMGSADTGTTAAPVVAPAAPAATGTTAVPTTAAAKPIIAPPEAEPAELKDLNTRYEKAANDLTQSIANIKQYDPASAETPEAIRAIKNRIRSFIGPEPDNTKWQGNLNELMAEAKQMMHPTLGNALVQFGLNLMASRSHYFGQAVGEAGVAAMGDREKQQQQGRALWVQAMDMGLKLQGRTDAYNEKLGQMGIQEQRLDQSAGTANYKQQLDLVKQKRLELDKLGTERDKAQTAFNKAFSGSPAGRLVQLNQVRQSMNQPPLTTANATAQEMEYYQFGTKPTAASDKETETTLAVKAAKGDKNAAKALSLLGKGGDADFQSYLNPGAAPTATAAPATAPAGAVAPTTAPTAGAGNAPAAVTGANPLNTPLIQGVNLNRDESVLQNLPPDEAAIVRALASYRLALPARQSLSKPVWQNRMKAAMLYDPSFSQQNYEARQKVLNDYTSGKSAQNIQAFQTLIQHAQRLDQNWAALHNFGGWLTPANTPWNWVLQNVRKDPRFAPLLLDMQAVPEEMMNLWRRVGGTKDEVDRFRAALDINAPPETQQAALKEILELSAGKLSGLKQQYENGMGRPADFHMISPQAEQTFSRHGIRFDDIDPGYAANMGGGAQPPAPTGGGRTTNRENLQRYMTDHPGVTYEQAKKIFQDKGIRVME